MFQVLKPKCTYTTEGSNTYFNIGFGNLGNVRIGGNAASMIMPFLGGFRDPRVGLRNIQSNKVIVPPDYGNDASKAIPSTRGGDLATSSLSYDELKAKLLKEGRLFEDPDFPATDRSLYYSQRPPRQIQWLRPSEICSNPQFITGGASRFDVRQGELGDCWLLAAIACLSMNEKLFAQIVPDDQDFSSGYCGLFRFHFWRFGEWKEVVVDDRLPTSRGSLVYIHSTEKNEFWSALMEKAYAKLCGSYEALKGGTTSEALEDFTGGIAEMFELRSKAPEDLFQIMLKSQERNSLMACSIQADPNRYEAELANGLIMGHAYSVTSVKLLDISLHQRPGRIPLVRIRNPWGNEAEWKGAWSDKSREWQLISPEVRQQVGLTFDDDGEFWMSFEDFKNNFEKLEICHLGPQSFSAEKHGHQHAWEMCIEHGSWQRRVTAGGCRNYLETFWINPQYRVTVPDPHEGNEGTMIVGLMQKNRRKMRSEGEDLLTIGYAVYELPPDQDGTLGLNFFKYNASKARSPAFINLREVCGRHKLKPGRYVIIPSTFQPNEEADFMLRIFSEQPQLSEELDDEAGLTDETVKVPDISEQQTEALKRAFDKVAGENGEIDSEELQDILNVAFTRDFAFDGFSLEACRSMISMMDCDRSSMLSFDEFHVLWNQLRIWKTAFKNYDTDKNGTMNSFELRNALKSVGFSINNVMFSTLVMRYSRRDGTVPFDEYVLCCARLRTLFEMFKGLPKDEKGKAMLDENTFVNMVLYM
ncbi:Calpain family cysteine protease [Fasciolopsis buskii]|uniref:Calpain family cysteine protease n=1 Tax=Fasciolopsis buskii TaxID=27845 RepID=A0A8E0VGY9_9TREM|nr:Calpain family cysteine protease [Fasciolopsis buski]